MKVVIYTTPTCPYCEMTKEFFRKNNVEYEEKDVSSDETALKEMMEKSGQLGVPVIEIDGKILVGYSEKALREALGI